MGAYWESLTEPKSIFNYQIQKTMKKKQTQVKLLLASLLVGGFLVTGCTNKDYDFDQIDATMGFGGDGLEIPASSTMDIPLKDVLELEDNGCVVEDAVTHNYVFRLDGEAIEPVHPQIEKILITKNLSSSSDITLGFVSNVKGTRAANAALEGEGDIYTFDYSGAKPAEVVELSHADVNCDVELDVNLSGISSWTSKLDKVVLTFPSYMEVKSEQGSLSGNVLTLTNVPTSQLFRLKVQIVGLDFTKGSASGLVVEGNQVKMNGKIHMMVQASNIDAGAGTTAKISNNLVMSSVTVESATGKFNPTINLNQLGKVNVTGIPDFLQGGNVKLDLYNPVIKLQVANDMAIEGKLNGVLKSFKNGQQIASVNVDGITVGANQTTTVYLCRRSEGIPTGEGIVVKVVPNLSAIIKTIPDEITFDADASANKDKEGKFLLGHTYTITPSYSVEAPIAFDEDAVIEYSDNFDGWNDDIDDLELSEDTYVTLTADALNKIPATLLVEATPLGTGGGDISNLIDVNIKQGTVKASLDGVNAETSPLEIEIREKVKGGLKKLDGLAYKVLGKATYDGSSIKGVTLNAEKHTLKLENIKIKLVGRIIGDFN